MSDKEFADGLNVEPPREGAPDFVKGRISIKRKNLGNWLRGKDEEWINLDIKVGKSGKWYAEVNNWKPKKNQPTQDSNLGMSHRDQSSNDFDDDITF